MRFQTCPPDDPAGTVASVIPGYYFDCVDVAACDLEIAGLVERLGLRTGLSEQRKRSVRADIDRLLEERTYLALTAA